jgi:hypothetical protein
VAIRTKHLLYIVIPALAVSVSVLLLLFFLSSSNDSDFLPVGEDRENDASLNQKMSNTQPKGQNVADDYYLRGAVSSISEGKQVQEKNLINLCGGSFEKRTDFIREYTLPFPMFSTCRNYSPTTRS